MRLKGAIGPMMLKGIGGLKGSGGKVKLPRRKSPKTVSTTQYRQGKEKYK